MTEPEPEDEAMSHCGCPRDVGITISENWRFCTKHQQFFCIVCDGLFCARCDEDQFDDQ